MKTKCTAAPQRKSAKKSPIHGLAAPAMRYINLDASGTPTPGDHIAVLDNKTGLIWSAGPLRCGAAVSYTRAMSACADLELLGQRDWRAPTIAELLSIVDYTRSDPALDTKHFTGPYGWTWSSTVASAPAGDAWYVNLGYGSSGRYHQTNDYRVRAVRPSQQLAIGI